MEGGISIDSFNLEVREEPEKGKGCVLTKHPAVVQHHTGGDQTARF